MGICFPSPSKHHTHWIYFFKAIGGNHRTRFKFNTCYLQSSILLHLGLSSWSSAWWVSPFKKSSQISCKFEITRDLMMIYLPPCTSNYFHTVRLHIGLLPIWTFLCRSRNFPTRLIWRGLPSQSLWICHLQDDHVMSLWMTAWGASLNSPIFCVYWCVMIDFWLDYLCSLAPSKELAYTGEIKLIVAMMTPGTLRGIPKIEVLSNSFQH